ncbi:antibiotic biosynthesis monooxygenase [Marivirga atlantica]|jgi:quinol monooxygenase YgiN|uniref:Antibiotic biosynthesis monooxygenase n=1 Tax=Marivirga atlantica TaxID=1548457 RepID=A0A937AIW5_9BACT|nr:antibiotic biosynthesis monooxygenase family protein [Marivirga atlantica]MBL0766344.1 antibiotic biosynthesis monooxygenase [Marivirga atlantica]
MIIRIVRMTFREDKISEFLAIFDQYKEAIRKQPGCTHLELLQDYNHTNVYSTYSYWDNEEALNNYRHSETFGKVWPATKKLFSAKPEAHSYLVRAKID